MLGCVIVSGYSIRGKIIILSCFGNNTANAFTYIKNFLDYVLMVLHKICFFSSFSSSFSVHYFPPASHVLYLWFQLISMIVCTHTHLYEFFFITYSAVYINHISKELNLHVLIGSRIWSSHLIYIYIYIYMRLLNVWLLYFF